MKKSRFSEQQIAFILKQAEDGTTVEEVCRKTAYQSGRRDYNEVRPRSSLGNQTPMERAFASGQARLP